MNYSKDVISFFKKHHLYDEAMFEYFKKHSTMIDYNDLDARCFVGCFHIINKDNILVGVHVNTPYVCDKKTMLITIHELIHAIMSYRNFGTKYKTSIDNEVLPLLFEKIYIEETNDPSLKEYAKKLDKIIEESNDPKYLIALKVRDELYKEYTGDIDKIAKISKKMVKKLVKN